MKDAYKNNELQMYEDITIEVIKIHLNTRINESQLE